eukprot:219047-Chlamydomonas_euryale.AAC.2
MALATASTMSTCCTTGISPASAAGQGAGGPKPANNARDFPRCVCSPEASAKRCSASMRIATEAGWRSERQAFVSSAYWPETDRRPPSRTPSWIFERSHEVRACPMNR